MSTTQVTMTSGQLRENLLIALETRAKEARNWGHISKLQTILIEMRAIIEAIQDADDLKKLTKS